MDIPKTNGSSKPKIAIFHYSAPPNTSGVDIMVRDQARLFRLYNYKVEIVAAIAKQFRKDIPVHIIRRMNPRHPKVLAVRQELERGVVSKEFWKLEKSLYQVLFKYISTHNINVCILHNLFTRPYNLPLAAALARLAKDLPNVKFIAWVHDVVFYDEPETNLTKDLAKIYPWNLLAEPVPSIHYVCVSNFLKNNLLSAFGQRPAPVTVIPNGRDVEKFLRLSPAMRQVFKDMDGLHVDLVGCLPVRAIPRKNIQLALRIARAILDRGVKFKLLLTANIDYKRERNLRYYESLKQLAQELNLGNNVFFLEEYFKRFAMPRKPPPPIPVSELFLISDFLLFTSSVEGFGLPLLEAGLTRCPIFANDIPPLREIGSTNIHYFKDTMQPTEIADFILDNIKKLPQAYFYRKIIKNFSLHTIFENQVLKLIEDVIQ